MTGDGQKLVHALQLLSDSSLQTHMASVFTGSLCMGVTAAQA